MMTKNHLVDFPRTINDIRRPHTLSTTILLAPAPPITSDWPPHSPIPYSNHDHVSASHYQKKIYGLH